MTTSRPASATETTARVRPAMQPKVFYAGCHSCCNAPYFRARGPDQNTLVCIP